MQYSHLRLNDPFVSPTMVGLKNQAAGFILYPALLWAGLTWQQMAWQQWIYQQAWAQAQTSFLSVREFKVCAADIPRAWRN